MPLARAPFGRDDCGHARIAAARTELLSGARPLVTSNYVLLETSALLQRRLGLAAVHDLDDHIVPLLSVRWITEPVHGRAMIRLRQTDRREVSLVDCSSFSLHGSRGAAGCARARRRLRHGGVPRAAVAMSAAA